MSEAYILPQALYEQWRTDTPPFVIDVRGSDEYAAGHIPGAHHIPGDQLAARLDEIPRDRLIVPY